MSRRRLLAGAGVYGALAALAFVWAALSGDPSLGRTRPWLPVDRPLSVAVSLGGGLLLAAAVIWGSRVLVRRAGWARELHLAFRELLGPLRSREIALVALTSGVAEELFFRGAMQPSLGLWATSLLFGALHVGPSRAFLPWTLSALAMGLLFGALFALTGELVGPVVAHVLINYENLHFIEAFDPRGRGRRIEPPSLVGRSLRACGRPPG